MQVDQTSRKPTGRFGVILVVLGAMVAFPVNLILVLGHSESIDRCVGVLSPGSLESRPMHTVRCQFGAVCRQVDG